MATDTARSFGLGRLARMWRVTVPSAVPYIATGIRISSAVALILAVTAELVIGSAGLGREINAARSGGNLDADVRADRRHRPARLGAQHRDDGWRAARAALASVPARGG